MSIRHKTHFMAMCELFELITIAFTIALFADLIWCVRDLIVFGFSYGLFIICFFLFASSVVVIYALLKYHHYNYTQIRKTMYNLKIGKQRSKLKKIVKHNKRGRVK